MIDLYQHQKDIIQDNKHKTGLFLGTGSSKTLTALLLAEGKILCITPKQQREEQNFIREAKKFDLDKNITQMSKEDFKKYAPSLKQYDTVILDEVDTMVGVTPNIQYRGGKPRPKASQIYNSLKEYLEKYPPKRLYLLTATPTRTPMCVWALGQLLGVKWNFYEFRDHFYFKYKKGYADIFMVKKGTEEMLGRCVRKLGYTGKLEDYVDVPEQTFKTVYVDLTPEQKRQIKKIRLEYPDPLVQAIKVHQIENGTLKDEGEMFKNEKLDKILDYALEFQKMCIFARYTLQVEQIQVALSNAGYTTYTLTGNTKDRKKVLEDFNKNPKAILIAQSTISSGYEIPDTPVMVFASIDYSFVNYQQAIGRVLRINHLKKNLYIHLVTRGGIDDKVYKTVVVNKADFHNSIYAKERS